MDAQSGNEIADLTPQGIDDNDPDYLPDGRIIFKTDRFSVFPELRIALMNDDGSGVLQFAELVTIAEVVTDQQGAQGRTDDGKAMQGGAGWAVSAHREKKQPRRCAGKSATGGGRRMFSRWPDAFLPPAGQRRC